MEVAIGIDLGGTNVKGILLGKTGEVLRQHYIPTNDDTTGNWRENVLEMVRHLSSVHSGKIEVIGLSCPGLANEQNKRIAHMPGRLQGLENFDWETYFSTTTFVINDAHAALIAEAKFGAVKGFQNAVLLTLGTGVGGAILINGELYQGQYQMAGHFGHTSINTNDDELSIVGMPGSLEYALGAYSVQRRSHGRFKTTHELVNAYNNHDHFATWLWLDMMRKLAIAMASIGNTLSPQIIVLAGGITQAGESLLNPLNEFLNVYEHWPANKKTPVCLATFSDLSGAVGAAAFAFSKLKIV